jgi:hypothetical protein
MSPELTVFLSILGVVWLLLTFWPEVPAFFWEWWHGRERRRRIWSEQEREEHRRQTILEEDKADE